MNKRHHTRLDINLEAEMVCRNHKFKGVIENFSSGGLGMRSDPSENLEDLKPGESITVKFQANPVDLMSICYKIKWLKKYDDPALGMVYKMGMEYSCN
jgi:c-di-GMP-binding flagellar brake protein YcgR